jgi:uncharacterized protein YfaA (DUF2138 family)
MQVRACETKRLPRDILKVPFRHSLHEEFLSLYEPTGQDDSEQLETNNTTFENHENKETDLLGISQKKPW